MPTAKQRKKLAPDVLAELETRTMQAVVLWLDAAVVAVGRGKNFFYRMIWDSLAWR